MRVDHTMASVSFQGEDGDVLTIGYDNRGDPYRKGVRLDMDSPCRSARAYVFLEDREATELRDLMLRLYPLPEKTK